ncbi:MAG: hypothetical protein IJ218_00220 [Alphaproteobacteria bacterium]|nr:hypothetical protein [Alphaproteobacteria bacterium]
MSEKYFAYILISALIVIIITALFLLYWRIRLRYLQNLTRINILKRQQTINQNTFFSTVIINSCVQKLFFLGGKTAKSALLWLVAGKPEKAIIYLESRTPLLALFLNAHINPYGAYRKISQQKRLCLLTPEYGVFLPILTYLAYNYKATEKYVNKLSLYFNNKKNNTTSAYYNYIASFVYMHDGEMLSASQNASAALKVFQKKQYAIETAACHLLLAEIYRISCVNDVASAMIDSAIKIYQTQNTPLFEAKAVVAKGMLMVFENRYEEAAEQYQKAIDMPITEQLRADIYNQQTLLLLIKGKFNKAEKLSKTALNLQQNLKNQHGLALALQLSAQIAFAQKKYVKTIRLANRAVAMYELQQNYSAQAECLYLAAESRCKQHLYGEAEKYLRTILWLNRRHPNSFHTANAYSLLGLIYMQRHDLQRAKVLFQQSLHLEQSKQRCEGMVADYANLALIEELTNNPETAVSNWQTALEYAHQSGDIELENLISIHCTAEKQQKQNDNNQ